jgi:hypothetical protein
MKLHALLGHPVSENFVSWCQILKNSSASFLCIQETYRLENVLKGLPDKIRDQLSRHHTQMHFKSNEIYTFLNHFQIAINLKENYNIKIACYHGYEK